MLTNGINTRCWVLVTFSSEGWKCFAVLSIRLFFLKLFVFGGSVMKDSAEDFFSSMFDSSSLIPFVEKNLEIGLLLESWSPFSVEDENAVLSWVSGSFLKLNGGSVLKDSAQEFFSSKFDDSSFLVAFVEKNLVIGLLPSIFNFICTKMIQPAIRSFYLYKSRIRSIWTEGNCQYFYSFFSFSFLDKNCEYFLPGFS